jgi:DNA-binding protein H-NS
MSREDVIRRIVERDMRNEALVADVVLREAEDLHAAACQHFGTWDTALQYAGISVRRLASEDEFRAERVLKRLRSMCCEGYDLSAQHNIKRDRRLYEAARQHFGTWRNALRAAGINLEHAFVRRPRKHDKQKILDAIKQRHESGETLMWTEVCLENRAFASAVKQAFGSWRKGLIAAGIDPTAYRNYSRKQWDQQRVIACLRKRRREGKSVKCADVQREYPSLVNAAHRYFGSWREAMRSARLDSVGDDS